VYVRTHARTHARTSFWPYLWILLFTISGTNPLWRFNLSVLSCENGQEILATAIILTAPIPLINLILIESFLSSWSGGKCQSCLRNKLWLITSYGLYPFILVPINYDVVFVFPTRGQLYVAMGRYVIHWGLVPLILPLYAIPFLFMKIDLGSIRIIESISLSTNFWILKHTLKSFISSTSESFIASITTLKSVDNACTRWNDAIRVIGK